MILESGIGRGGNKPFYFSFGEGSFFPGDPIHGSWFDSWPYVLI
jgi:hypothetical protein